MGECFFRAENPTEGAGNQLECALGSYVPGLLSEWQLPVVFDAEGAAGRVPNEPDVWTGWEHGSG